MKRLLLRYVRISSYAGSLVLVGMLLSALLTTLFVMTPLPRWFTVGDSGSWISFFGNVVGGIIGAIVAFVIARTQVEQQRTMERDKRFSEQLPALVGVQIELEKIQKAYVNMRTIAKAFRNPPQGYPTKQDYRLGTYSLKALDETNWSHVWLITSSKLQTRLLKLKAQYAELVETLNFPLDVASKEALASFNLTAVAECKLKEANKRIFWDRIDSLGYDNARDLLDIMEDVDSLIRQIDHNRVLE